MQPRQGPTGSELPSISDPKELARTLQAELTRVGCALGTPDGVWGPASQQAMQTYNKNANTNHDASIPSMTALADVRTHSTRVCPLTCKVGYKAEGGACVAITCPTGQAANAAGTCVAVPIASPPRPRNCTIFNGMNYCD
jgi:hypothetical protein